VSAVRRKKTLTDVDVTNNRYLNVHEASERTMQYLLKEQGLVSSTSVPRYIKPVNRRKRIAVLKQTSNILEQYALFR